MDDFDDITCEEYYGDDYHDELERDCDEPYEPDVDTYTEYQDLPWGGDDQFETCNFCEDF